jgi:hypothetical protein
MAVTDCAKLSETAPTSGMPLGLAGRVVERGRDWRWSPNAPFN